MLSHANIQLWERSSGQQASRVEQYSLEHLKSQQNFQLLHLELSMLSALSMTVLWG